MIVAGTDVRVGLGLGEGGGAVGAWVLEGVGDAVWVGSLVAVLAGFGVGVLDGVGDEVTVAVGVRVLVGVRVGVADGDGVAVSVLVGVAVLNTNCGNRGGFVAVGDAVGLGVSVRVAVGVAVRVAVGIGVRVLVDVGVWVGTAGWVGLLVAVAVPGTVVGEGPTVEVGVIVGGSPWRANVPEAFQPVPTKIWTS